MDDRSRERKAPAWKIIDRKEVYDNPWITVHHMNVIAPTGNKGIYGKVHYKHYALGIIPVDPEWNIWLVGQQRFPIDTYSWELPEGGGKVEREPLPAAQRELLEETGLKADQWQEIMRLHLSNSVSDELAIVYIATGLSMSDSRPDATEMLEVRKLPFDEAFEMAWNGIITDTMTVAGLLKLHRMRELDLVRP